MNIEPEKIIDEVIEMESAQSMPPKDVKIDKAITARAYKIVAGIAILGSGWVFGLYQYKMQSEITKSLEEYFDKKYAKVEIEKKVDDFVTAQKEFNAEMTKEFQAHLRESSERQGTYNASLKNIDGALRDINEALRLRSPR